MFKKTYNLVKLQVKMLPFEKLISLVNLIRFSKQVQLTPQETISPTLKRQTDSLMPSCLQHGPGAWGLGLLVVSQRNSPPSRS